MNESLLLIVTGFSCNNNCLICSVAHCREIHKDRDTTSLKKELLKERRKGFKNVEFIGGEPTIRKDITDLIMYAKKIGYKKIAITTNGRMLSYKEFAKKIVDAGANKIAFSLYGANALTHNGITRTPGSFEQILQGIKNIKNLLKPTGVYVNTVVCKQNYKQLDSIAILLKKLGIKYWNLLALIPEGRAKKIYNNFSVGLDELSFYFNNLYKYSKFFNNMLFIDYPFCIFPKNHIHKKNYRLQRISTLKNILQEGYNPENPKLSDGKMQSKIKLKICKNCEFNNDCGGIIKDYYERYGDIEIIKLKKQNFENG